MLEQNINKIANEIISSVMTVNELFEHPFSKIALSTGQLAMMTSRRSVKYAKGCISTSKRNDPKNGRWTFTVRCHEKWSKGPYDVRFRLTGKGPFSKDILSREIQVSCTCNAWKYNGPDWNARAKDYSERELSNGQAPNIRDPQRRYLICKHIAASIPLFRRFIIPQGFKELPPQLQRQLQREKIQPKVIPTKRPIVKPVQEEQIPTRQIPTRMIPKRITPRTLPGKIEPKVPPGRIIPKSPLRPMREE